MNPTVLITGASGGIGEELARLFAAHGYDLVLVARSEDKLQSLSGGLGRTHGVQARALAHLTRLFLPGMLARRSGKILNVASTAAYVPGPFMAVYYASKAFVLSFSEALAEETQGTGVTVTALIPGPTETNFAATAGNQNSLLFRTGTAMRAAAVARVGYDGLMAGKRVAIAGVSNKLTVLSTRVTPRTMLAKITRKLNS